MCCVIESQCNVMCSVWAVESLCDGVDLCLVVFVGTKLSLLRLSLNGNYSCIHAKAGFYCLSWLRFIFNYFVSDYN